MQELAPEAFAALVAPVVDRVHAGAHQRTRAQGGTDLVRRHGVRHAGLLITLRFVLPRGPLGRAAFPLAARYLPADGVLGAVDELVAGGWLVPAEGELVPAEGELVPGERGLVPGERCAAFLTELYDQQAAVLGEAWPDQLDPAGPPGPVALGWLADTAGTLLAVAAETGGPAFTAFAPPHERVGDPPALVLFNRLAALRYHRSDAHAAAWSSRGLTAAGVQELPAGTPLRREIEVDTNHRAAPPFAALTEADRLAFLAGLAALA